MVNSIELQVISRILTTESEYELDRLCSYDTSYYSIFTEQIQFILDHKENYGNVPDVFTFQAQYEDIVLIQVSESLEYLEEGLRKNKQRILFLETFNKLADLGSADVTEAWDYLALQCEKASSLDSSQPMNIVKDADKRSQQIIDFNKSSRIPTGFKEVDDVMYGGLSTVEELVVMVARTNTGKAQPLWSKVLTPHGWKTMGEVQVGDILVGKNGDNGKVVQIFPQGIKDYYRVTFTDGTQVECCKDHLWEVYNSYTGEYEVVDLSTIISNLHNKEYLVEISSLISLENLIDLYGRKLSYSDRVSIEDDNFTFYHGFDDGVYVFQYTTDNIESAAFMADISRSLGRYVTIISTNHMYRVESCRPRNGFKLFKQIVSVEYVGKTECQCILLDNASHTYITDGFTVTHNTWVTTKIMESAQSHGFPTLYYSPEMRSSFIGTRFDTWRGHFKNSELFRGKYSDEYNAYLKNLVQEETGAFVVEDSDMSEGRTTVKALENLVKKYHIKLLIIDGLSYLQESKRISENHLKYKNICDDLFRLSKTYQCAVVVSVQANRETRDNRDENGEPFPNIYNIAESDHPARVATQVFAMRQLFDKHILEIRLEKSRNAKNDKPTFSYVWDPNTGSMELVGDNMDTPAPVESFNVPKVSISQNAEPVAADITEDLYNDDDDEDLEF